LLFSYPLHTPGNTSNLRDAEVLALRVPMLFVRGKRDAFSQQALFDALLPRLSAPFGIFEIEDGDHGLKVPKSSAAAIPTAQAQLGMQRLAVMYVRDYILGDTGGGGVDGGGGKGGGGGGTGKSGDGAAAAGAAGPGAAGAAAAGPGGGKRGSGGDDPEFFAEEVAFKKGKKWHIFAHKPTI
jgi:hypothetical protein